MKLSRKLTTLQQSPWVVAFFLFSIFLLASGYTFGWDDQHLEVPLLKQLIDGSLYQGDYYVESLRQNFSSYFYPILAKFITVDQIQPTYFALYLISRFFLIFWMYKLWLYLFKDKLKSFSSVLVVMLIIRVEELFYRTFSHQEFALAIIFAGIYYFFRGRFILSAVILGISANFHALYSLFPMLYMCGYLLLTIKQHGIKTLLKTGLTFTLFCIPFLTWAIQNKLNAPHVDPGPLKSWLSLYLAACPQNFIFPQIPFKNIIGDVKIFYQLTQNYLFVLSLFILNLFYNKEFTHNKKAWSYFLVSVFLLTISVIFTYIKPSRFVIDLNLIRNIQFLLFLFAGYTTSLIITKIQEGKIAVSLSLGLLFCLLKFGNLIGTLAISIVFFVIFIDKLLKLKNNFIKFTLGIIALGIIGKCMYSIGKIFSVFSYGYFVHFYITLNIIIFAILTLVCLIKYKKRIPTSKARLFIIFPLIIFVIQFGHYHYRQINMRNTSSGFWSWQRNWEDMQRFVKHNTHKNAMIFVPYNMEMGGFRIQSERKIVMSYRDCGIIGFDYGAALEWQKRLKDVWSYKIQPTESPMPAIKKAIVKYKADYIVFRRVFAPKDNILFKRVYTNKEFVLFKVMVPQ